MAEKIGVVANEPQIIDAVLVSLAHQGSQYYRDVSAQLDHTPGASPAEIVEKKREAMNRGFDSLIVQLKNNPFGDALKKIRDHMVAGIE